MDGSAVLVVLALAAVLLWLARRGEAGPGRGGDLGPYLRAARREARLAARARAAGDRRLAEITAAGADFARRATAQGLAPDAELWSSDGGTVPAWRVGSLHVAPDGTVYGPDAPLAEPLTSASRVPACTSAEGVETFKRALARRLVAGG
ncbi:hypothetical protein [Streptomyces sp. RFCAC02]|uniref:hypothetical protein n=1 Tax=Streptomyces sp. RFCAC02 TaxID=2499143 RepID=UPI00102234E2|nr:hypothetical protein [Streptomyces sp. RFCAC02]